MQTCSYCGKENEEGAFNCRECATELEAGARVRNVRKTKAAAVVEPGSSGARTRVVKDRALIYVSLAVSIGALGYAAWVHQHSAQMAKQMAKQTLQMLQTLQRMEAELAALAAPTAAEMQPLQGTWEGVELGQESRGKITLTITGHSLHFHRATNHWFETTITLPADTDPQQLRARINGGSDSIGKVVAAIFKIEDGTLTLAADQGSAKTPKSFEDGEAAHYEFLKVQLQKKNPEPPKSE